MQEYGGATEKEDEAHEDAEEAAISKLTPESAEAQRQKAYDKSQAKLAAGSGRLEGRLIQQEKRNTGNIKGQVYSQYFKAGRGWVTVPLVLGAALLMQGAQVLSGLWVVYWNRDQFSEPLGFYVSVLSRHLAISESSFIPDGHICRSWRVPSRLHVCNGSSYLAFHLSILCIAPRSEHVQDILRSIKLVRQRALRTHIRRLRQRCSESRGFCRWRWLISIAQDVLDSLLSDSLRMTCMIFSNVLSSVALVSVFFPYFLAALAVCFFGYAWFWQ